MFVKSESERSGGHACVYFFGMAVDTNAGFATGMKIGVRRSFLLQGEVGAGILSSRSVTPGGKTVAMGEFELISLDCWGLGAACSGVYFTDEGLRVVVGLKRPM